MLFPRWPSAVLAVCALPFAVSVAWVGCATAEEDPGSPSKPRDDGGTGDSGEDAPVDEDGRPIFDAEEAGLACPEAGAPNSCATATEIATLAVGGKTVVSGQVTATGERWYKVSFTGTDDPAAHPYLKITSTDPGIVFEVLKACSGGNLTCGQEDGGPSKQVTEWEMSWVADPEAGTPDPGSAGDPGAAPDARIPFEVGVSGVVYLRVFRKMGTPKGCDFKIDVSN